MTQLWSYRGKAQPGIPAIDCRFHYANHFDNYADLVALFNSRIYNQPMGSDDLAGCIIAFWNDRYIDNTRQLLLTCSHWLSVHGEVAVVAISTERLRCCGTTHLSRRLSLPSLRTVCFGTSSTR